jgi:hypothetical protein
MVRGILHGVKPSQEKDPERTEGKSHELRHEFLHTFGCCGHLLQVKQLVLQQKSLDELLLQIEQPSLQHLVHGLFASVPQPVRSVTKIHGIDESAIKCNGFIFAAGCSIEL